MKSIRTIASALLFAAAGCGGNPPTSPGGPVRLLITQEPADSVQSGRVVTPSPVAQLADGSGQAVAQRGVLVSASLANGAATVSGTVEVRTDDQGRAVFDNLILAGAPNPVAIRFASSGLSAAVSRSLRLVPGEATSIEIRTGSNQVAAAGTAVPVIPTVRILDATGNGIPGLTLIATVEGGGSVQRPTITTDANGVGSVERWTLGPRPGENGLTIALEDGPSVTIAALGVVGPPSKLTIVEGNNQSAVAGQPVATDPAVRVTDAFDNPIAGVTVSFTVATGGGILTGPQPESDAAGLARLDEWKLGPEAGPNTLQATRPGVTAVTFTATADPVPATILAGNAQLGFAGAGLRTPIDIKIANGFGVARAGVTVTFTAAAGSGSFSPATAVTDTAGRVTSVWTVGTSAGPQTAQVTAPGAATSQLTAEVVRFKMVAAGRLHSCGLTTTGQAFCWGDNRFGQVSDSTFLDRTVAVRVKTAVLFDTLAAATSGQFTCGIATTGESYCWGSNNHGQSGDGTNLGVGGPLGNARPYPTLVLGGLAFKQLSAGGDHICGLVADGSAYCWGRNFSGELGNGGTVDQFQPTAVQTSVKFKTLSAGDAHTCGIELMTNFAWCWGSSANFRLGLSGNPTLQVPTPTAVQGGGIYLAIAASALSTCSLSITGVAVCWGNNGSGQLGDGTFTSRPAPAPATGSLTFTSIAAGGTTVCARPADGRINCWGENDQAQAGLGVLGDSGVPAVVPGGRQFLMVSVGESACAVELATGAVYCWGPNTNGQVGDGTVTLRAEPTLVRF